MGSGVNIWALLADLAAFTGWTLSRFTVPRRVGWVNLLGGVGILALFFSFLWYLPMMMMDFTRNRFAQRLPP